MAELDQTAFTLEISRRFDAAPETVFDAWLGKEWGEWLPPAKARCEVALQEPRPGGRYLVRMTMGDGRLVEISGTYREIDRPRKLVLSWTGNYNNQETIVTLTFRPDGAGTIMTLRQDGFPDEALRNGYNAGWTGPGGSFDKLAQVLARRAA
jgi:uncharacterized protein YndB with AHSA1/START domain